MSLHYSNTDLTLVQNTPRNFFLYLFWIRNTYLPDMYKVLNNKQFLKIMAGKLTFYFLNVLWVNAKKSNLNLIQAFWNISLRKLTNSHSYVPNYTLRTDLKIKTVKDETLTYYKWFRNRLASHSHPLIKALSSNVIPGNAPRRLKRNWCRDMLT